MAYEKNPDEMGALWEKQGERVNDQGKKIKYTYLTGKIEVNGTEISVVCFEVNKKGDKSPKWRILKAKPREESYEEPF